MKKLLKWLLAITATLVMSVGLMACTTIVTGSDVEGSETSVNGSETSSGASEQEVVITVTGVTDGQKVVYGTTLTPVFDKGVATLSVDGGASEEFESGTTISEIGFYVLTVTYEETVKTVNFEITLPDTTGRITDEFVGGKLNGNYYSSDGYFKVENRNLVISDKEDGQAWAIVKHKVEHVNVTDWPYMEINVISVANCYAQMKFANVEYPGAGDVQQAYTFDVNGIYYINVKEFAENSGLDLTDTEIWLDLVVAGDSRNDGKMSAVFDYYKSVKEIAPLAAAERYVDNTPETINQWIPDTANVQWFEGDAAAVGAIVSSEGYGKVQKRVTLNTKEYPYLTVTVTEVVNGWALKAYVYENYTRVNNEITLQSDAGVGVFEINLQRYFGVTENADVLLQLYIMGKSDEKTFAFQGFEQVADPVYDITIEGISDGDTVNAFIKPAAVNFDKGVATISKDGGEAVPYASGENITEAGEYTVNIVAGKYSKSVTFTVIVVNVLPGIVDQYESLTGFTNGENSTVAMEDGSFVFTKQSGSAMAKLEKRYDLDFTNNVYVALNVTGLNDYTPDAGFGIEILDDVNWFAVQGKANTAAFVANEDDGSITIYWDASYAYKTDGSGTATIWYEKKTNLKVTISIEYGETVKSVQLNYLRLVEELPFKVSGDAVENYLTTEGFTVGENAKAEIVDGAFIFEKQSGAAAAKLEKRYDLDFRVNNYVVLNVKGLNGYTPDAGFGIEILDDYNWINVLIKYDAATLVVNEADGSITIYWKIETATKLSDSTSVDWSNV
ncbi:MAG: hypothetical protein IJU84_09965, partial [Clostridia bacterium]|nr:hypothetical protein [Clostridia bacterium]